MTIDLTIDKIVAGGEGIGRYDEAVVFVPGSAPGDRLRVNVQTRKRTYWRGVIDAIIEPSPLRVSPQCRYYGRCGGCNLQHLDYDAQLVTKKLVVNECLQRIGKTFVPPGNPLSAGNQWHYRNKTQYPVSGPAWRIGFFEPESHNVVDVEQCLTQPPLFDRLRAAVRTRLNDAGETPFHETTGKGNVRHIILKHSPTSGETVLLYVTAHKELSPDVWSGLAAEFPEVVSIMQSVNPRRTNRILGDRFRLLQGQGYYTEKMLDLTLRISGPSFFQANTPATELLVKRVLKYLEPDGDKTVLDLYCGVGTISLPVARFSRRVIGIEVEPSAVADARANIEVNRLSNVEIVEAQVEQGLKRIQHADAIIADPPRRGLTQEVIDGISTLQPQVVVYVSCNPATLARDLARFAQKGYETVEVQPIDMFPQTIHVETVAKLVRADRVTGQSTKRS
jgi:23S rRNA (uracil1939-C5)-methyltransferase